LSGLSDAKAIMVLNLEGSLKAGLAAIVRYIEGTHLLELATILVLSTAIMYCPSNCFYIYLIPLTLTLTTR